MSPASLKDIEDQLGTGNGNLLFALREAGYAPGRISGLDYSVDAVKLVAFQKQPSSS
ncbi:hypothetical protein FOMPIDRAFT_83235 [Fomitopsis schrenkii]|uniref:Uncharacterized protein n=1 Tax=Fomitopsis schrenkii TaxID=2126942 RepID=S8FWS5_FOMSC|nr:hypothetical protein FOMPIDRAFT_83235 [Fomitopsis schrenkii]